MQDFDHVATCLVTGNLEPIGWGKMKALGVEHLFSAPYFGGFGSDFCSGNTEEMWKDRCEFVNVAADRARQQYGKQGAVMSWRGCQAMIGVRH